MRHPRALALAVCSLVVLLAGCSGDDGAGTAGPSSTGPGTSSGSAGTSPTTSTADALTKQLLGTEDASAPVATVRGSLVPTGGKIAAIADILEVRASGRSTLLRWRLRSAVEQTVDSFTNSLSSSTRFDTAQVAVKDRAANKVLNPYTYLPQRGTGVGCVCSAIPNTIGPEGQPMYALYPPLGASSTTVDVVLPGFAVAKGVPVTRR